MPTDNGQHLPALNGTSGPAPLKCRDPETSELTARQEAAALALARGFDVPKAARMAKAGLRTVKTWNATVPAFGRRIREIRLEMTVRALGVLTDAMTEAAQTLRKLLGPKTAEQTRMVSARAILELGPRLHETVELEQRIRALEEQQG